MRWLALAALMGCGGPKAYRPFPMVSAGERHSCAVGRRGEALCWGHSNARQLAVPWQPHFVEVAAGPASCGLTDEAKLVCWGPGPAPPAGRFVHISMGHYANCALDEEGVASCWGVLRGTAPADATWRQLEVGGNHICGVRTNGTLWCWGANDHGQTDFPVGHFSAVTAGAKHSCALRADDHRAECWGDDSDGQSSPPAGSFSAISAGSRHTCALRPQGALVCWGSNAFGQTEAPLGSFIRLSAGALHSCAVRQDRSLLCWGDNRFGQTSGVRPPM